MLNKSWVLKNTQLFLKVELIHNICSVSCSVMSDSATPKDCSMPGLPVHHQLLEHTQTHVHCFGDAIQPSLPLSSPSPPTFNLSHHQGLFKWISSFHQVAKVLEFQFQHQSFQWNPNGLLGSQWTSWISLQSMGLSRVFSNTTVQKHQFFGSQISLWSSSHIHTWLLRNP